MVLLPLRRGRAGVPVMLTGLLRGSQVGPPLTAISTVAPPPAADYSGKPNGFVRLSQFIGSI
jgi:hypothetical protein